jgi:hypothetical protein
MTKLIKIMTALTKEQTESFIIKKKIEGFDNMPHIHSRIKDAIRTYMQDNVGYDQVPLAALSRYNNSAGEILNVKTAVSDYIPTLAGSVLFELHMPEDMIVSVGAEDLITYTNLIKDSNNDELIEIYMEEFKDHINLGYLTGEADIVSFIPFIDLNRCKFFAHIDRSWNISELDIPGVEQLRLANMSMF